MRQSVRLPHPLSCLSPASFEGTVEGGGGWWRGREASGVHPPNTRIALCRCWMVVPFHPLARGRGHGHEHSTGLSRPPGPGAARDEA